MLLTITARKNVELRIPRQNFLCQKTTPSPLNSCPALRRHFPQVLLFFSELQKKLALIFSPLSTFRHCFYLRFFSFFTGNNCRYDAGRVPIPPKNPLHTGAAWTSNPRYLTSTPATISVFFGLIEMTQGDSYSSSLILTFLFYRPAQCCYHSPKGLLMNTLRHGTNNLLRILLIRHNKDIIQIITKSALYRFI